MGNTNKTVFCCTCVTVFTLFPKKLQTASLGYQRVILEESSWKRKLVRILNSVIANYCVLLDSQINQRSPRP